MTACPPIEVLKEQAAELNADFLLGPIVDERGSRFLTEAQIAQIGGLRLFVFSNEHPPPHFRVTYQGASADYVIETGQKLVGDPALQKFDRNIRKWWAKNKLSVAQAWNKSRPSGCTVGPVDTVGLGWETAAT